jgi:hypothetical protein
MRRAAAALAGALALLAGCGGDHPGITAPPVAATTGTVVLPEPATTATVLKTPQPVPERKSPESTAPGSPRAYLKRLDALATDLVPAVDRAAKSGTSTAIAKLDAQIMSITKAWLESGGAASAAAASLAAAIATARSNVETPLLADESKRQIQAARAALARELAAT